MATGATMTPTITAATTTLIIIITTTTGTPATTTGTPATTTGTPVTTGPPAPWYRAAPILPIAPSVTSPTTRRPGRISATMVCGILAHKKAKKERLVSLFFFFFSTYFQLAK